MTVQDAIAKAERLLPGHAAPEGTTDPRWQAIIAVGEFVETEPDAVWPFVARWGSHEDDDLRAAVATCLLEHLLEYHFDRLFPRVASLARANKLFADTVARCWEFGEAREQRNRTRLKELLAAIRRLADRRARGDRS
jgi:hypothetical protein